MSMNRTCAISSWISFLTSAGIPIYLDMYATEETSQQRSRPSRSREMIVDEAASNSQNSPFADNYLAITGDASRNDTTSSNFTATILRNRNLFSIYQCHLRCDRGWKLVALTGTDARK